MARSKGISFDAEKLWIAMGKVRARDIAILTGVSAQAVANWFSKQSMPVKHMLEIRDICGLTDREVKDIFK